jgi:hypothetical protein
VTATHKEWLGIGARSFTEKGSEFLVKAAEISKTLTRAQMQNDSGKAKERLFRMPMRSDTG